MPSGQKRGRTEHANLRALRGLEWRVDYRRLRLELVARQGLEADLAVNVPRDLGVKLEEIACVLAALAKPSVAVRKEGARLLYQPQLNPEVQKSALAGDASIEQDVELGPAKGRRNLVLDDFDLDSTADDVGPVLDGVDTPNVQSHGRVELQRAPAGGGLWATEHHADLLAQLVGEDQCGAPAANGTRQLAQRLRHEPRLQAHVAVTHLAVQ